MRCVPWFALAALVSPAASQTQGPGLGNLTYDASELFQPVDVIVSTNGHGMTTMVNGYLLVPDVGDVNVIKAIEFWDVSDPRDASRVYRHANASTQELREAHAIALSTSYGRDHLAMLAQDGIQFWDVTDPAAITLVSYLFLPDIPPASYTGIWWLFWQAPWLYVGGTSAGVYIARIDDIANPQFVKLVPPSQLGGIVAHYTFAVGNLLVLMTSISPGFSTLDISDPANPFLLQTMQGPLGYSHIFAAGRILTSGGDGGPVQMFVHDVTPDGALSFFGSVGSGFSNGAYGSYQDGFFHSGMSDVYVKFDVQNLQVVGTATSGLAGRDEDFCQVLGNLAFVGDDHGIGSGLYVHDTQPDSRGPAVAWVHPSDGAQNVALTSRIGVSMSDNVDFESAAAANFVVRPLGGAGLSGKYSVQMGLMNFCPDQPLSPDTVYEVVIDGIEDLVGNSGPVFRSTFATGSSTGIPPPTPIAIQNLTSARGKPYRTGSLQVGALIYIDREYRYTSIPARLQDHTYILTANDDVNGVSPAWITFDIAEPAQVNLLYDDRATALPAWLQSWTPTGETASGANLYDVYKKEFPAGPVALGGNGNAPAAGAQSMYTVAVLPSAAPPTCAPPLVAPVETNALATFLAGAVTGAPPFTYSWSFGDGSPPTAPSPDPIAVHAYTDAGRYPVAVTVTNAQGSTACAAIQIVYDPRTTPAPAAASTIVHDGARVITVNPDGDTAAAIDATTLAKLWERPVGDHPRTLALGPNSEVWVVCQDDATIRVLRASDGEPLRTIDLPRGSRPFGLAFRPDGSAAYVTLESGTPVRSSFAPSPNGTRPSNAVRSGKTAFLSPEIELARLLELDPASGAIQRRLVLDGNARALAVAHDSSRIFVARFVSPHPASTAIVWEIDAASLTLAREHRLQFDPGPDTERSGRGVPNYLTSLAIAPDGQRTLVPSKKDNTARGLFRSGEPLTFESRTRTIVSQVDLIAGAEDFAARLDLNDRDMAQAALWSPLGDLFLVAAQGSNAVEVFDAASGSRLASLPAGRAPQGLVFSPDGNRLFVQNFLSRSVTVYDTSALVEGIHYNPPRIADVTTQAAETLSAQVLHGKRIFYNADDRRMNLDGYIACASCHLDGDSDGQVWDFTQVGEGLRNTIPLVGRAGLGHANVHWTANFDEIHDFENDIRFGFSGSGFMLDPDFQATEDPLGAPKAGLSSDLDALAAFVASLDSFPPSPFRRQDGSLTPEALLGQAIFASQGCATCHFPPTFTDGLRHDVGTIQASSGLGIGQPLAGVGFETPTLHGLWDSAPYLHNGQARTLEAVLNNPAHGGTDALTPTERAQLARYLLEIE